MKYIHKLCTVVMFILVPFVQTAYALDTHAQSTSSTPLEASGIACPSSDTKETQGFKRFLSAFIKDGQVRQAYTPSTVDVRTLDLQLADRQDMYTRAVVPQETILSALFNTDLATQRKVKVTSVESERAVVSFLYPQHLEDKDTLIFEKNRDVGGSKLYFVILFRFPVFCLIKVLKKQSVAPKKRLSGKKYLSLRKMETFTIVPSMDIFVQHKMVWLREQPAQ